MTPSELKKGHLSLQELTRNFLSDAEELISGIDSERDEGTRYIPPDLGGLIDEILTDDALDIIGRRIENQLPKWCRPRAMLGDLQSSDNDNPYEDTTVMTDILRYLFLILTPERVMIDFCALSEDKIEELLDSFRIPSPANRQPFNIHNPSEVIKHIIQVENDIKVRQFDQSFADLRYLQKQILWIRHLVIYVLQLSLAVFLLYFENLLPQDLIDQIKSVLLKDSEEIIDLMVKTHSCFQSDNGLSYECMQVFGRASPFEGISLRQYERFINECDRILSRKSHEDISAEGNSSNLVFQLTRDSRRLIQTLIDEKATPKLISVMGRGWDWYGNPIVWFTEIQNVSSDFLPSRELVEWMYAPLEIKFDPFDQFALIPIRTDLRNALINPVLHPLQNVVSLLEIAEKDLAKNNKTSFLKQLRETIEENFSEEDLKTLCFELGIDYADLPAQGRKNKVRELVSYLDRYGRVLDLFNIGRQERPDIAWGNLGQAFLRLHYPQRSGNLLGEQ